MGGAVSAVTNAVTSVVGGVTNALGITSPPKPQVIYVDNTQTGDKQAVAGTGAEGGTPTQEASEGGKQAFGSTYASQRRQGVSNAGGGATMLTGPTGVQEKSTELGKKTLLGE